MLFNPQLGELSAAAGPGLLVVVSASLGIVARLDVRAARSLFVVLKGVLLLGWARPGAGPRVRDHSTPP